MKMIMHDQSGRRRWRAEFIEQFLQKYSIPQESLSNSTLKCLDDWARQVYVVEEQPSANLNAVVLNLCCAVESELAVGLGSISGLGFLSEGQPLGDKARVLEGVIKGSALRQRLQAKGFKPGAVSALPKKLFDLAALRRETGAAHGGVEIGAATHEDAQKAKHWAGIILRDLIPRATEKA
jgi:hypothetical protein